MVANVNDYIVPFGKAGLMAAKYLAGLKINKRQKPDRPHRLNPRDRSYSRGRLGNFG